ncbi:MAG: hypothetical protein KC416_08530 [Myxococcales bacterium]|nr:hypothetical protein [Myxococcales bacterium]
MTPPKMSSFNPTDTDVRAAAFSVIERCGGAEGLLRAAAGSALYPHVWTRDVGLAALGILAAARTASDRALVADSLACIARHQDPLGRMPLKVDVAEDCSVLENSAGVDAGMWFALATHHLAQASPDLAEPLVEPALRAMAWVAHLDVNGDLLLETPEASDWADMMPHRHHVLFVNVLYVAALRAAAALSGQAAHAELADKVAERVAVLFAVHAQTDAEAVGAHLARLSTWNPEWALTAEYASKWGELPFLLPYVGFRAVGRHCDVVGNSLAILTGVADAPRSAAILDYFHAVGVADPWPSKTSYPPLYPGDPDYRDHFHWRNLNLPHHYQNGGSWPFCGALHGLALVHAGRLGAAEVHYRSLVNACFSEEDHPFPEWQHGVTGRAMGERDQLWSATGVLLLGEALRTGRVPYFGHP